jgi:hypothetical protein
MITEKGIAPRVKADAASQAVQTASTILPL